MVRPNFVDQNPDPAAQGDPADADRFGVAEPGDQPVLTGGGDVGPGRQAGPGPGRAALQVEVEAVRDRSRTIPPSVVLWPAVLWPPLRTASSSPASRAMVTIEHPGGVGQRAIAPRRSQPP